MELVERYKKQTRKGGGYQLKLGRNQDITYRLKVATNRGLKKKNQKKKNRRLELTKANETLLLVGDRWTNMSRRYKWLTKAKYV